MKSRSVVFVALALAAAMSAGVVTTASGNRDLVAQQVLSVNRIAASVVRGSSLLQFVEGSSNMTTGSDGRLTVLLLGSDSRGGSVGLTDTIMVFSLREGSISALSIPRDTGRIPNPDGGTFPGRINSLLQKLKNGRTLNQAMLEFERVVEHLLHVEIDYHALIGFNGFQTLVEEIEPVSVDIHREIKDSKFWDDPRKASGVYFPAANGYNLFALQPEADSRLCDGLWRSKEPPVAQQFWCRRAMPFVRSRKGTGNSDFARARRQQDFVVAAIRRTIMRGSGGALNSLVNRANGQAGSGSLTTNIPITMSTALDLFDRLSGAKVDFRVVLSPPTYSTHIPGGTSYELDLGAVRRVTRDWFGSSGAPPPMDPSSPTDPSFPDSTATPAAAPDGALAPTPPAGSATTGPLATPGEAAAVPVASSNPGGQAEVQGSPASEFGAALPGAMVLALLIGVAMIALFVRRLRLANLPDRP